MLLTPHTFVGIAIATGIPDPYISFPLSFGMHFMGDLVPHWDFYSNTTVEQRLSGWRPLAVMADLVLGVAVGLTATYYALWGLNNPALAANIFMCGIGSVLPDALESPHLFLKKDIPILNQLGKIQGKLQFQAPLPWGMITQIIVIGVCALIAVNNVKAL